MAFHDTKENNWLTFSIHKVILTCLGEPFFPDTVYCCVDSRYARVWPEYCLVYWPHTHTTRVRGGCTCHYHGIRDRQLQHATLPAFWTHFPVTAMCHFIAHCDLSRSLASQSVKGYRASARSWHLITAAAYFQTEKYRPTGTEIGNTVANACRPCWCRHKVCCGVKKRIVICSILPAIGLCRLLWARSPQHWAILMLLAYRKFVTKFVGKRASREAWTYFL